MNSGEFGTRHQEFGALHRTNWISLNLAQVGIELWWGDHIWLFFCDPPNHTSFHPPPPIQVSGINIFLIFTSLVCYHWILQNFIAFLRGKIKLIFCRHRFLCLDLWPKPWMFFPWAAAKLMFYQTPVLPMILRALFCSTAADNAPSSLLGFAFLPR